MNSYIDVVDTFRKICEDHELIKTFTNGDIFEADLENVNVFKKAHLIETSASINKTFFSFTFDLLVMDLVNIDDSDQDTVMNDTFLILADILREFRNGKHFQLSALNKRQFGLPDNISCEPFTDRFENLLAGWKATFTITAQGHLSACDSPIERNI